MKIFIIFLVLLFPQALFAAERYNTGFRTVGVWLQDSGLRLDMNIWYPTTRKMHDHNFMPWSLNVALNAPVANGIFPLLALSHASPGTRFSYHYLASFLVSHGYIVFSPTHPTDSMNNMDDMFTWRQLEKRAKEISACLDMAFADQKLASHIEKGKIGFIGFGSGAAAGLLLAGAQPNCNAWPSYCARARQGDPYCSEWAIGKMKLICDSLSDTQLRDDRFKALALVAPAYGMLFDASSFPQSFPPVLLVGAGRDLFNNFELHCEPLARILGKKANYLHLASADATALMNACPPAIESELPELCNSVSPSERAMLHEQLEKAMYSFFGAKLLH